MRSLTLAIGLAAALATPALAADARADRIVSIGGPITEIIVALGQQDRIIARDTTSNYPPAVAELPDVGYARALSPEGVLSVDPDLIIAEQNSGPPETIEVLEDAGVSFVRVPDAYSVEGVAEKIRIVGEAIGEPEAARQLADEVAADLRAAIRPVTDDAPGVLFIISAKGGRITAGGQGSSADGIIAMAGGRNVMTDIQGYKQVSDEAVAQANPDVILMMDRKGDHGLTDEALFSMPAIAPTNAAENKAVVRMDGMLLLGFGPRVAEAVTDLSAALQQ
ncbi:heme/hemin ABC transporter substrate-binding protein [Marinibacterium profundimaris]|uniref:Hemin ABC transporter substrate-binding protein n=1 Tax=Marinibacterium profundimaris TaxID=1679460 RepID=A0A225NG45_9RHOB|nr:ABC transporter substrate-binding protein [Marinibacterium profundimaris]OWU72446.1 hemin ABC transporter substrate-binding protein [Marinibacterium profundimaris]